MRRPPEATTVKDSGFGDCFFVLVFETPAARSFLSSESERHSRRQLLLIGKLDIQASILPNELPLLSKEYHFGRGPVFLENLHPLVTTVLDLLHQFLLTLGQRFSAKKIFPN